MNNKRLVEIMKDPGTASEKEIKEIKRLSGDYSYSPFLKILQARIDNLHDRKNKSKSLTRAAIYIADRSVLKAFISNDKLGPTAVEPLAPAMKEIPDEETTPTPVYEEEKERIETLETTKDKEPSDEVVELTEQMDVAEAEEETPIEEAAAAIEDEETPVIEEEEKASAIEAEETPAVKEEKAPAIEVEEELIKEDRAAESVEEKVLTGKEEVVNIEDEKTSQKEDSKDETRSLSNEILKNISELKKHKASLFHFLEMDDKKKHKSDKKGKSKKKLKGKKKDKKEEEVEEANIIQRHSEQEESIKKTPTQEEASQDYPDYEEEDPEVIKDFLNQLEKSNPPPKRKLKREEQEKLIEKFIQSDPQMQSVRSSKEISEKKDLSLPSVKFRDDIISENLACIMVKQGKHEKAIDIYKKLIWKFPQKKAYFATQIEALKKKSGK